MPLLQIRAGFWIALLMAMTLGASVASFQSCGSSFVMFFHPSTSDCLGLSRVGGNHNHPDSNHIRRTRLLTRKRFDTVSHNHVRLSLLVPPAAEHHHLANERGADATAVTTDEILWFPKIMGGLSLLGFTLAIWCTIGIAWLGLTFPTHLHIAPR